MTEREKLVSAMSAAMIEACMKRSGYPLAIVEADMSAALDVAMEEAAKVAEMYVRDASFDDSMVGALEHNSNQANIAAAIRALKEKP